MPRPKKKRQSQAAGQKPGATPKRKARRRGRRGGKSTNGGYTVGNSVAPIPHFAGLTRTVVGQPQATGSVIMSSTFIPPTPTPIKHKKWGDGVSIPFNMEVVGIGKTTTGVGPAVYDHMLPFSIDSTDLKFMSLGFKSQSTYPYYGSSLLIGPELLPGRILNEIENWNRYRFTSLTFTYVTSCSASTAGQLVVAYGTDPVAFMETDSQEDTKNYPDIRVLSQCRPIMSTPVWVNSSFTYRHPELSDDLFYCRGSYEVDIPDDGGEFSGYAAFLRSTFQGRISALLQDVPTAAQSFGRLWVSGNIEYYDPVFTIDSNINPIVPYVPAEDEEKLQSSSAKSRKKKIVGIRNYMLARHAYNPSDDPDFVDLEKKTHSKPSRLKKT